MKNKLKELLKLGTLLLFFAFISFSCQNDNDNTIHEHESSTISDNTNTSYKRVSLEQLKKDGLFSKLTKEFDAERLFSSSHSKVLSNKSNSQETIVITDTITVIEKENYKSYTFLIRTASQKPNEVKNLILEKKDSLTSAFILTYQFTPKWLQNYFSGVHSKPEGTIYLTPYTSSLSKGKNLAGKSMEETCSWVNYIVIEPCACGHFYTWQCKGCDRNPTWPSVYNSIQYVCESTGGTGTEMLTTEATDGFGFGGSPSSTNTSTSETSLMMENNSEFVIYNNIIKCVPNSGNGLTQLSSQQRFKIANFIQQNGCTQDNSMFARSIIDILSNTSLTETEKTTKFSSAYDNFDPLLPQDAQVSEYEAKIKKSIQYFRWYGNEQAEEFADYLESLLPLNDGFSKDDYYSLYKTIRSQTKSLVWDYVRSIVGVTIESFKPVIEVALWEVGGGLALKMLSKLPVKYLTTPIKNVITRLTASSSQAFSQLKHAKKYGIQSYKNLKTTFDDLGLSLSKEGVQRHHLFEQRFVNNPNISSKLGTNTDDWLSIVVEKGFTGSEHYNFTQAWKNAIPYKNSGSTLNTLTATWDDVVAAARDIYKDYPEILKALGI